MLVGHRFIRLVLLAVAPAVIAAMLAFAVGCSAPTEKEQADFSGMRSVAELSTLKAYYHNTAAATIDADGPLASILKTGYKRIWIEYSGTVEIGVDVNKVTIGDPSEEGVVEVHIPDSEILNVYLDRDSVSDPIIETGLFASVSAEEKMTAIAAAQDKMREQAANDQTLATQAYDRARRIIKAYVENVGTAIGETYSVKWV